MKLEQLRISNDERSQVLYYHNTPVLKYTIQYPIFSSNTFQWTVQLMNLYYRNQALRYEYYVQNTLYQTAVETYLFHQQNGYTYRIFEAVRKFTLTYQKNCLASLYFSQYSFLGGAHGNTVQQSDTWDLYTGDRLSLDAFFPQSVCYTPQLIRLINMQIQNQLQTGNVPYFEHYPQLVQDTFHKDHYYLTPKGLSIYFQQYDIAPYVSGVPTFVLPYDQIGASLPKCAPGLPSRSGVEGH